jgi:LuxR family maltose regulon positive regulatory protein
VVAPAGWGKTTLISEWIARQSNDPGSRVWVSLDAADNDPNRFLLYLSAALDTAYPGLGESARSLLLSPQPVTSEVVLTILLNEISALEHSLTVVLDDYHLIEAASVHAAVTFLLEHLPPSLYLLIATRLDPPLPLSSMRARGQLVEIRAKDLRFTYEDAAAFLNSAMGLNLNAKAIASLEERTEGWIAGLQLAALSLKGKEDPSEFIESFTGSNRYIVDYLFDEVLGRQPEEVQTFLVETSILNRMCGSLCDALLEREGSQLFLEMLEARNLFLIPLDEERGWYRYHHLFADVLRARLARQGRERVGELHLRASAWYTRERMVEEAVFHALEGKHLQLAARLIEEHSDAIRLQGGLRMLERWLKALPADLVASSPMLSVIQASIHVSYFQLPEALAALDTCQSAAQEEDAWTQDLKGRVAVLRSHIMRHQSDIDAAVDLAREALTCLSKDNWLWRDFSLFSLGVALYAGERLSEAGQAFREARTESRKVGNAHGYVLASIADGQLHHAQGALQEAGRIYREALGYATERKYNHPDQIAVLFTGLGRLHYQWNDLTAADTAFHEGLKRTHPVYPLACYLEILRLKQARDDLEGILALIRQLEVTAQQTRIPWLPLVVTVLKIHSKQLDEEAAATWVQSCEARATDQQTVRMHGVQEMEDLTWAHLRLAQGQTETVRARLESLLATLIRQECHGIAMEFRALLSTLYHQQGRMDRAVSVLEPSLALGAREGYVRVFVDAGRPLLPVLIESAARGLEPDYVARLLEVFRAEGLFLTQKYGSASALVEPLSEREREVMRLLAAGLSNSTIAEHLFLSVGTVKRHVHNIFLKLDVPNRVSAIARARELHLL